MRYFNLIKNVSNWYEVMGAKSGGVPVFRFRLRHGVQIELPREILHDFKMIVMNEVYSYPMPLPLPADPIIVDVGANVGSFSAFAAARYPGARILAFEPDARNFARLKHNAELNPGRIEPVNVAMSDQSGEGTFVGGDADRHTTGGRLVSPQSGEPGRKVTVLSLQDAFARFAVERCDFLKLDCEGSEFNILYQSPDTVLARIRQMVIEVHPDGTPAGSRAHLARFLAGKGFATRERPKDLLWAWRRS